MEGSGRVSVPKVESADGPSDQALGDYANKFMFMYQKNDLMGISENYKVKANEFLDGSLSFQDYESVLELQSQEDVPETKGTVVRRRRDMPPALMGLMGQANIHYVKQEYDDALKICLEIVRQEPMAPHAFQTLADIYNAKKEPVKSLQFAMIAAYLRPSQPDQWLGLAESSMELGDKAAALTCYTKAIKYDPTNVDAHITRAKLLEEKGDKKGAVKAYHKMVEVISADCKVDIMYYSKLAAQIYKQDNDIQKAKEVMNIAFSRARDLITTEEIVLYVDLLITLKEYFNILEVVSKYCDVKIEAEEDIVADAETNQLSCSSLRVLTCEVPSNAAIEIRVKLTVALIHLKACRVLNMLLIPFLETKNVEKTGNLYLELVDALMCQGMFVDALKFLKLLVNSKNYNQPEVWLNYADCLRCLGKPEEAISAYLVVLSKAPKQVNARLMVSELLNDLGRSEEAISALTEDPATGSLDVGLLYERCLLLKDNKERSDEFLAVGRWLMSRHCVRIKSRDDLQPLSKLKGYARKQEALKKITKPEVAEDSMMEPCIIEGKKLPGPDDEWDLFLTLCNTALETKQFPLLQRLVFSAMGSSVFNSSEAKETKVFFLAILSCYFNKDALHGYNLVRDLIVNDICHPTAWNLFNCIVSQSEDTRHYKFIIRQLTKRKSVLPLTMIHANICFNSGSYKYALSEYLTIHKQNKKDMGLVVLMTAVTLLQMSCQKFTDFKNSLLSQAVAFLHKYKETRGPNNLQEVNYNFGRFYHQVGILPSAIYHYKEGLKAENPLIVGNEDMYDLKKEIAFNLVTIYQSSGATELARYYTNKYLVF